MAAVNWPEFEVKDSHPRKRSQKHHEMKPCLRILFYLNGNRKIIRPGVMYFYEKSLSILRSKCQYHFKPHKARYDADGYLKHAVNNKNTFDYLPDYLNGKGKDKECCIVLETTTNAYGISDMAFEFCHKDYDKTGYVSLLLPVYYFQDFSALVQLGNDLASRLPFFSGYIGYAVNIAFENQAIRRFDTLRKLSKKYYGMDFRLPVDGSQIEQPKPNWQSAVGCISNVSWLTYVNKKIAVKVKLKKGTQIITHKLRNGCGYQLSKEPSLLRRSNKGQIDPYRELAKFIQKKDKDLREFHFNFVGGKEDTPLWLRRFVD